MKLACEECGIVHDIPDDKRDDFNIYRKWDGVGTAVTCNPCLLCPKCSEAVYQKAISKENQ